MCFTQLLFLRKDVQAKKNSKANDILIISTKKES